MSLSRLDIALGLEPLDRAAQRVIYRDGFPSQIALCLAFVTMLSLVVVAAAGASAAPPEAKRTTFTPIGLPYWLIAFVT